MGDTVSQVGGGGALDPADQLSSDAVSGLTKLEISAVQESWAKIYLNYIAVGTQLLKSYLSKFPEAKKYFKILNNVQEKDYEKNVKFKAHVMTLMNAIDLSVKSLEEPLVSAALMQKLGSAHGKRKIKEQDFENLKQVLVKLFVEELKLDKATLKAWEKTLEFWYKNIFETLSANA